MNFLIGFEISYNNLNLPTVIYTEGDMGLYYTYLSDGTKIKAHSGHVGRNGNALFPDGSSEQCAAGRRRRRFGDRTERLLSVRQTMGCGCGSDFRQPSSVLRKGGAGISESSLCRFRGAHVQSRLGTVVHAGSVGGEVLSVGAILLLHK